MTGACAVTGCTYPAVCRGWCSMHYERWRRKGDVGGVKPTRIVGKSPAERLIAKCEVNANGCWEWTGKISNCGYGVIQVDGRQELAHRFSYASFVGPIPDGLQIDHLCRVRHCANPAHLEPVTLRENLRRGREARQREAAA